MQHTDCKGAVFQYYANACLVGLRGRLYFIRPCDREGWARCWARFLDSGSVTRVIISFCHIEGEKDNVKFGNTFPDCRCHVMIGFYGGAPLSLGMFVLSSDSLRDHYDPIRHPYVDRINSKWRRVQRWMRAVLAKIRQQRALALAMAWHVRLGHGASISALPVELIKEVV